jgi:hypothetical protein
VTKLTTCPSEQLGDLHRVRGGALAEVVADAPERQAVGAGEVFADAADEHVVLPSPWSGIGYCFRRQIVDERDPRRRREQLPGLLDRDLPLGLHQDALAVAVGDGHADAGRADLDRSSPKILCVSQTIFISSEV